MLVTFQRKVPVRNQRRQEVAWKRGSETHAAEVVVVAHQGSIGSKYNFETFSWLILVFICHAFTTRSARIPVLIHAEKVI
jgi:hypothetical protein